MGNSCSGSGLAGMAMGKHVIACLWSLELSLVCLKAGWAEQKACPHGQEEKWNVELQTLPGCSSVGLCRVNLTQSSTSEPEYTLRASLSCFFSKLCFVTCLQ